MIGQRPIPSTAPSDRGAAAAAEPLFLVGAARSGTSLLYKTLCLHPDVSYISNWVRRAPGLPVLAVGNRIARRFPRTQLGAWFDADSNAYVYGKRRPLFRRLFPAPVEGEPVFARCGVGVGEVGGDTEHGSTKLRRTIEAIRRYSDAPLFVSKRIANNRRIPALHTTFPGARFVEIIRDGRAVAYSLSRVDWWADGTVWWCGITPREWSAEGRDPWELCARNWVEELNQIEDGLTHIPNDRVLRLTYEEMVDDPIRILTRVARFAGLSADPTWTAALRTLRIPNRNEGWRTALEPDALRSVESIQRGELARHGYVA